MLDVLFVMLSGFALGIFCLLNVGFCLFGRFAVLLRGLIRGCVS